MTGRAPRRVDGDQDSTAVTDAISATLAMFLSIIAPLSSARGMHRAAFRAVLATH